SVSLWFPPSLAVVMPDALTGAFNTTFFAVVFLVGCFEFAFMVSLLSLFFLFLFGSNAMLTVCAALHPKGLSPSLLMDCRSFRLRGGILQFVYFNLTCRILPAVGSSP